MVGVMKKTLLAICISIRFQFVILAAICIFLGFAYAYFVGASISWFRVLLAFVGGISAHAAVDLLNDWHDTRSGLDAVTQRTPFSGGSGALQRFPDQVSAILVAGVVGCLIPVLCGIYFFLQGLWGIVPLGLLGLGLIVFYTPWLTKKPLFCLMAPGLAFGPLMVCGTFYVLTGTFTWNVFILSLIPFFLVNNLLLLNQFPDLEADRSVGRYTMPIFVGLRRCTGVLAGFYLATYGVLALLIIAKIVSFYCVFAFATAFPAFFVVKMLVVDEFCEKNGEKSLKNNVLVTLLTPLVIGVVVLLAH